MKDRERRMLEKKHLLAVLEGKITKGQATEALGVTRRSINRYLRSFLEAGSTRLYDGRSSNSRKLDAAGEQRIVQAKQDGPHRSARTLRDLLQLSVHADTVRRVLVKHHLERTSLPPVKPIQRL